MRYFNEKKVELLAPCGTFDIFKNLLDSGADAFYLGGKILNMRLHRKDYNFTNEELKESVSLAHEHDKLIYVTVNNLFNHNDVAMAHEFLQFLDEIKVDAILIQDFSVFEIVKKLGLTMPLHSSVMMNVHNADTIRVLQELGISRVVASREMSLSEIARLHAETNMEFEYFAHGDMCVAHGSQCNYSGMIFGKSSNRGMCMKPCRWNFSILQNDKLYPTSYPLAVKDMCMYSYIPEMIESHVTSFKIEGRMRDTEYLKRLIGQYATQIESYINEPQSFDRLDGYDDIFENRKRDLSSGYAFGRPGLSNINQRFEGTGVFYSTGKVFSNPIEEIEATPERYAEIKTLVNRPSTDTKISVAVNNLEQAKIAMDENVDAIYLSGEVFLPDLPFKIDQIKQLIQTKNNSKIYLRTPRMMFGIDFSEFHHILKTLADDLDGLVVSNLGAVHAFGKYNLELIGDYSLNIYNSLAASFYASKNVKRLTISPELSANDAALLIQNTPTELEIIVHGRPVVMYLEHDLFENIENKNEPIKLIDDKGNAHPVYRDFRGRNHLTLTKEICLLPIASHLGVSHLRIEGQTYGNLELKNIIRAYQGKEKLDKEDGFTLGGLQF